MFLFHHSRPLEAVKYGIVSADTKQKYYDLPELSEAYLWLENQTGFKPLFLAVGNEEWQLQMTGYQDQWRRVVGYDEKSLKPIFRRRGEFTNHVLFSFDEGAIGEGVWIDANAWWVCICGAFLSKRPDWITKQDVKSVFKESWHRSRWLRAARQQGGAINFLAPSLDLQKSKRVWVRNRATKEKLERLGFQCVAVRKMSTICKIV